MEELQGSIADTLSARVSCIIVLIREEQRMHGVSTEEIGRLVAAIDPHDDHRLAMAFAVAGLAVPIAWFRAGLGVVGGERVAYNAPPIS